MFWLSITWVQRSKQKVLLLVSLISQRVCYSKKFKYMSGLQWITACIWNGREAGQVELPIYLQTSGEVKLTQFHNHDIQDYLNQWNLTYLYITSNLPGFLPRTKSGDCWVKGVDVEWLGMLGQNVSQEVRNMEGPRETPFAAPSLQILKLSISWISFPW